MTDIVERLRAELADVRADATLLRAKLERLRAIEDAAIHAATYFHMGDGGEEDFDEQRMIDLMAKLSRALELNEASNDRG